MKKEKARKSVDEDPEPSKRPWLIAVAFALTTILAVSVFYSLTRPTTPRTSKAAIIDQLNSSQLTPSSRHENASFIQTARTLLLKRFPEIDYYSDNATVDQYRALASRGYKFILWRTHSALASSSNYVAVFTSEKYGTRNYNQYLDSGLLTLCNITDERALFFGITPKFVKESMPGRFEDTVIVFMSCNGLNKDYLGTADAFAEKGAKAFISWDGWIAFSHNDAGVEILLQHLVDGNDTIREAVAKVPTYSSGLGTNTLHYYPFEAADYRIPDYRPTSQSPTRMMATVQSPKKAKIESS